MKKFRLVLAIASLFVPACLHAATFQNITNWIGTGTNQAGFEIDWNNGTTNDTFLWGYRWNGDATGEQMLDALAAGDPRLYAEVSGNTQFGTALFGLGLDHDADNLFPLNPALSFTDHLATTDYGGVNDDRTAVDAGDLWQEGWYSAGYWSYYLSDEDRLSADFTDWDYASTGMTERILENNDWDGWVFARDFNDALPSDPFPGTGVVDTTPRPTLRLVHGFDYTDGGTPGGTLVVQGGTLYGLASGGTNGNGVIFSVQTNGDAFADQHTFGIEDGGYPLGGLLLSGGTLYGTTRGYGAYGEGTVFSMVPDGSNFAVLHNFTDASNLTNADGATPQCGLTLGDNNVLYGSTDLGGQFGSGNLFRLQPTGKNFATMHSFSALNSQGFNSDGYEPSVEMVAGKGVLYGVVPYAGTHGAGTLFRGSETGTGARHDHYGFAVLHEFSKLSFSTNADGAVPFGPLLLANGVLFGTAYQGGYFGSGCIFSIGTDGGNFKILHSFGPADGNYDNTDGAYPVGNLVLDGSMLYGVTQVGGLRGQGTVYQISTNGSEFYSLAQFPRQKGGVNITGAAPGAGLIKIGDSLYGTTTGGGPYGSGTVFALDLPSPNVSVAAAGSQLSVTWPVWAQKYVLEMSPSLTLPNWQPVASGLAGTNFVFRATMPGKSAFFRLQK